MGLHQMPGNVWWRSWRVLPPPAPFSDCLTSDPDFSWQGQWPMGGYWQTWTDPQSGEKFTVWEGHYTYPGTNLTFIPTYSGGMFEGADAERGRARDQLGHAELRPGRREDRAGADQVRDPAARLPGLGNVAVVHARRHRELRRLRRRGPGVPVLRDGCHRRHPNEGLSQCHGCATEDAVTPHASFLALDVAPQQAYANISALRRLFPGVYGADGFFDSVDPTTGAVGHRYLVLDQSMIMAALDNALNNRALQRDFAATRSPGRRARTCRLSSCRCASGCAYGTRAMLARRPECPSSP